MTNALPGVLYFDQDFAGSTDDEKMASLNAHNASYGDGQGPSNIQPAVMFGPRQHNFSTPIQMFSGMSVVGTKLSNAHGTNVQTKFNWLGPAGSSMLAFPGVQKNQGYPSDGSPRDMYFANVLFNGPSTTHFIEYHNPVTESNAGRTVWYSRFHDCAWTNFQTIHWGWVDGTAYDGSLDISEIADTAFFLSGAESILFGRETYSQADASDGSVGVPFIRSRLEASLIGWCLYTGRGKRTGLSIEGGSGLVVDGFNIDAQPSQPIFGAGIHISNVDGLTVTNTLFRCMANAPANAVGGLAQNRGWVHISGGSQITFQGNTFYIDGNTPPPTGFPLAYATGVGQGQVKWGYNNFGNFKGHKACLQQSASGMFTVTPDPNLLTYVG